MHDSEILGRLESSRIHERALRPVCIVVLALGIITLILTFTPIGQASWMMSARAFLLGISVTLLLWSQVNRQIRRTTMAWVYDLAEVPDDRRV